MKAYGALRESGKAQADGDRLIRGEVAQNDYAASHGIEVSGIFGEERIPGTGENRVAWPSIKRT